MRPLRRLRPANLATPEPGGDGCTGATPAQTGAAPAATAPVAAAASSASAVASTAAGVAADCEDCEDLSSDEVLVCGPAFAGPSGGPAVRGAPPRRGARPGGSEQADLMLALALQLEETQASQLSRVATPARQLDGAPAEGGPAWRRGRAAARWAAEALGAGWAAHAHARWAADDGGLPQPAVGADVGRRRPFGG